MKKIILFSFEAIKVIVISLAIVVPIRYFLFQPFLVQGESMQPNFSTGDYLIVDQITYRFKGPERGEVIIFRSPSDFQRLIKRVVGLPNETVEIKNEKITIKKGEEIFILKEDYLFDLDTGGNLSISLGENEYFVLGDNRNFSYDSRRFGVVKRESIIGRAILRLFPVSSISKIESPEY